MTLPSFIEWDIPQQQAAHSAPIIVKIYILSILCIKRK